MVLNIAQLSTAQDKTKLKKISLVYSDHANPDTGGIAFFKQEYIPKVQKELAKIGYELDIKYYHRESLYKLADQVEACEAGLIDITLFTIDREFERVPLHGILNMPFMGYNEYSATRIWHDLNTTVPEFGNELTDLKELAHFMTLPVVFNLTKLARVPDDFKGLKIESSGLPAELFRSIGAAVVSQSPSDWYTSLKSDLYDGISVGISGIPMKNLQEIVKYHIMPTGDTMGLTGISFVITRQKYNSFPLEVRKVIDDNVLWASNKLVEISASKIPEYTEICRKAGNTFIRLTPEEMKEWYDAVKPIHKEWIKKMEAKGLPGRKVYDEAKRLAQKYKDLK